MTSGHADVNDLDAESTYPEPIEPIEAEQLASYATERFTYLASGNRASGPHEWLSTDYSPGPNDQCFEFWANDDNNNLTTVILHVTGVETFCTWDGDPSQSDRRFATNKEIDQLAELVLVAVLGRKYQRAQATRDDALATLCAQIRTADQAGVGVLRGDIVTASGLARQTVWDALNSTPRHQ